MKTVYNHTQTAVQITGDHSHLSICANIDLVEFLGGIEPAFHEIKRLQNRNWFPRMGSQSKPLTLRDIEYARDNELRGEKFWQWLQLQGPEVRESTGYDYVYGYGYKTDTGYVIVNRDGSVFEEVVM